MTAFAPTAFVSSRRAAGVCAVLLAGSAGLLAQSSPTRTTSAPAPPSQQPPAQPTFRTDVKAVLVDLRVVDLSNRFVDDLTKDEFRVFEDDVEQTVATFSLVNLPITSRAVTDNTIPVAPDVVTNAGTRDGRFYVIVLDDLEGESDASGGYQALRSPTVRALARDFVERHLADNDRAALLTTSNGRDMLVQFTNDRQRLLNAIDRFHGGVGQVIYTRDKDGNLVRDNLHSVMFP